MIINLIVIILNYGTAQLHTSLNYTRLLVLSLSRGVRTAHYSLRLLSLLVYPHL